ncbi:hypothetical protein CTAYLR_009047 [Chrysophaeum taylorii]|uniref:Oxidation resistance protein 1 n=1 Tax=Chrysophaeum taylorii TaxID=2483200 RepID=A0AAD7UBF4_9STRA|nr:hypothetical protein CTAYLR_009047 [Chrysophaeum taylorii]
MRSRAGAGSFSSLYASVKAGCESSRPYVKPALEYAVCKRCGARVARHVDAIEAHEEKCGVRAARVEDQSTTELPEPETTTVADDEVPPPSVVPTEVPKSFSATSLELAETELCRRLSSESKHLFEEETSNVAGWQRYSVTFGAGRMGIEFEYDARGTRRLVVIRASREAASLGVRARDVLIGVGNRPVPRATDPIAVHRHLLTCARPVVLHFYRLHVRRLEKQQQPEAVQPPSSSRLLTAVWERLPTFFPPKDDHNEETPSSSATVLERQPSELPTPSVRATASRYDDPSFEPCVCAPGQRAALAAHLKPSLRYRTWTLVYDSSVDGMCLEALYARARSARKGPQLLLVRDDLKNVAGAFVDERVRNAGTYFGTGECFVFSFVDADDDLVRVFRWVGPYANLTHPPRRDSKDSVLDDDLPPEDNNEFPEPPPLPSIENDMFIYATHSVLGFGSGGGGFALRLDDALELGASRPCATYGTPASLFNGRDTFPVNRVQLFEFTSNWV